MRNGPPDRFPDKGRRSSISNCAGFPVRTVQNLKFHTPESGLFQRFTGGEIESCRLVFLRQLQIIPLPKWRLLLNFKKIGRDMGGLQFAAEGLPNGRTDASSCPSKANIRSSDILASPAL